MYFQKLPNLNNRAIGENFPHLATLLGKHETVTNNRQQFFFEPQK
jgi:hypothetical protein